MEFGITLQDVRRVTLVGAVLGAVVLGIALTLGVTRGTVTSTLDVLKIGVFSVGLAALLPILLLLAGLFSIRLHSREIEHLFLRRWVVRRRPVEDLVAVSLEGRLFPVVLSFRDGSRIHLLGLHLRQRYALVEELQRIAPPIEVSGS